ncbi:MAG: maltose alpha-D-glucosyltransferase [Planctomycetaceae bacterium]|nr:maltose alpha-D-glucosyltransferase [Planctomycetaceae bacterium]
MQTKDPCWYKDAIIYQLHVSAFCDTVGDGTGDFRGLTEKLDYLQDLGVNAIWLLPFYPSPLKDDGYDIADYTSIHANYGTIRDFRKFLDEAHDRGLRVITELVMNHTSDQHPWFQRARRAAPGSRERNFYVWSDTPEKYKDARIIFQDFEQSNWTWDSVAKAHFWHRFYSHQPDLNFESPEVRQAMFAALDYWLGLGVDGLRLDAVPYLFEREGTNCENLPETHDYLRALRQHVDEKYPGRMLLAEANQWPEDAVAYFGSGDESHMAFHFPLMPRMFMAVHMEDRFPIVDILEQTPAIPETSQWALFLRNHDELTLEMVTDEERDYMYRMYAQESRARINVGIRRRLAPLLDNNRRRIELMNGLLFSLPGTPVVYYGDEIGMGDNIYLGDRNGVRTPMQWSSDRNAGFSRANPQKLYLPIIIDPEYHYEAINVDAQQNNSSSLLWWMKRLIALRKRYQAFGRGSIEFLAPQNHKVLAYLRRFENEQILVVANLSRFAQYVELSLSTFEGYSPIELFGRTQFPSIGKQPYLLTLAPHSFYWFALEPVRVSEMAGPAAAPAMEAPMLAAVPRWEEILDDPGKMSLELLLPRYLREHRWFGGHARHIRSVDLVEAIPMRFDSMTAHWALIRVDYLDADPETYVLPLAIATGEQATRLLSESPRAIVARLNGDSPSVLYDAVVEPAFCTALLEAIRSEQSFPGQSGEVLSLVTSALQPADPAQPPLEPSVSKAEQSNTSIIFGDQMILKLFRKTEEGLNPDLEIGRLLTGKHSLTNVPPLLGALEYRSWRRGQPMTLGILQGFFPGVEDAWRYTLDAVGQFFERVLTSTTPPPCVSLNIDTLLDAAGSDLPPLASEMVGAYLDSAHRLGQRTAELHLALASELDDAAFRPEPFSAHYQRSLYQSMRSQTIRSLVDLTQRLPRLPDELQAGAKTLLGREAEIFPRFQALLNRRMTAMRIRCHGDYHLAQVLYTGKDFVFIDFEGETRRPLSERRIKHSPLRDVASMLRSFHYAVYAALDNSAANREAVQTAVRPEDRASLEPWARLWYVWVGATFLKSYLEGTRNAIFLPQTRDELRVLCDAFLLQKAIYELNSELHHRPEWLHIPLRGLLQMLEPQNELPVALPISSNLPCGVTALEPKIRFKTELRPEFQIIQEVT